MTALVQVLSDNPPNRSGDDNTPEPFRVVGWKTGDIYLTIVSEYYYCDWLYFIEWNILFYASTSWIIYWFP